MPSRQASSRRRYIQRRATSGRPQLPPMGHVGKVADIVDGILYLESATFMTGEILHINGGQIAGH